MSSRAPGTMQSPLTPYKGRGEMAMSPPRCARLFSLHSDFSQDVGARCSERPTVACSSLTFVFFLPLTCYRDDTGASGRRVSFKLTGLSSSRSRARAGVSDGAALAGIACSQWKIARTGAWGPQLLAEGHGAEEAFSKP